MTNTQSNKNINSMTPSMKRVFEIKIQKQILPLALLFSIFTTVAAGNCETCDMTCPHGSSPSYAKSNAEGRLINESNCVFMDIPRGDIDFCTIPGETQIRPSNLIGVDPKEPYGFICVEGHVICSCSNKCQGRGCIPTWNFVHDGKQPPEICLTKEGTINGYENNLYIKDWKTGIWPFQTNHHTSCVFNSDGNLPRLRGSVATAEESVTTN